MKIAYLVLCHIDPEHIRRLTDKLTVGTCDEAFVHVDKKSSIEPFEKLLNSNPQVHILAERVAVYWGGYSSIEATIRLFRTAISSSNFDRFVILQGLEYPIKTNREIHAFFEKNPDMEYILAQNISLCSNPREIHKYSLYWHLDTSKQLKSRIIHKINRAFLKHGKFPRFKKNYVVNSLGQKMDVFQGCAQFGVTRQLAEYIVHFHDENECFNRYFQTMYAPDESYFHTIVYNSSYVKNTPTGKALARPHLTDFENLTYFEYPVQITLFTQKEDWPKLRDSGFLFFRKASSESKKLLDYIDEQHRLQEQNT